MGLLYLTSVFSYNLDFTAGASRPCKIFNYISNTEVRYNNACLKQNKTSYSKIAHLSREYYVEIDMTVLA